MYELKLKKLRTQCLQEQYTIPKLSVKRIRTSQNVCSVLLFTHYRIN